MPALTFEKKDGAIVGKVWLWHAVKRIFQTLSDGEYIWPHPEKKTKARSSQQNRYYRGVVCKLFSDFTGYTEDESHQIFAEKFLSYEKNGKTFVLSTTKLKTVGFEEYMDKCRQWAAVEDAFRNDEGQGLYIPLPNEPDNFYYEVKR